MPARLVVLISGTGTLLQALIDATADPGVRGGDRRGRRRPTGHRRAASGPRGAGIPTFVEPCHRGQDRPEWDRRLTARVAGYQPDLVISAGFMKLVGDHFLAAFGGKMINTHPALLPAFPGMHGPRDALAYGVKITGATVFLVDAGVDTGVIVDQAAVPVADDDTVESLHERIKVAERDLLVDTTHRLATRGGRSSGRKVLIT